MNILITLTMFDDAYKHRENAIRHIRNETNCVSLPRPDGLADFVLVYPVNETAYIILKSPSSMVKLKEDNKYTLVIGYADNRQQFAEVIYNYFTD